jgi:hypothetical protein
MCSGNSPLTPPIRPLPVDSPTDRSLFQRQRPHVEPTKLTRCAIAHSVTCITGRLVTLNVTLYSCQPTAP